MVSKDSAGGLNLTWHQLLISEGEGVWGGSAGARGDIGRWGEVGGAVLSPRNSLAESNQFHGLSITGDITPIFSFPLLPIFPACLLCQWPCSAGSGWPGGGTRTHLFHPGALEKMHSSLCLSLPNYFLLLSPSTPHIFFLPAFWVIL